jgi:hypothetical protein
MEEEISNLGKKIYLLTYGGPKYISEISEMLYGKGKKKCKQVNREKKILVKNNWIKKVPKKVNSKDGRSFQRRHYYANSFPLYNEINSRLKKKNIYLDKEKKYDHFFEKRINEVDRLKIFLEKEFRETVDDIVSYWNVKSPSFGIDTVLDELSLECEYNLIIDINKNKLYRKMVKYHYYKDFLKWKEDYLQKQTSKRLFDEVIPAEYTEKYLGKNLMKKLRDLSYSSKLIISHLFSMAEKTEEELHLLFEYKKDNPDRMKGDINTYLKS